MMAQGTPLLCRGGGRGQGGPSQGDGLARDCYKLVRATVVVIVHDNVMVAGIVQQSIPSCNGMGSECLLEDHDG